MPKRLTKEDFVTKAVNIHGLRYDYSKVEYGGNKKKVRIICRNHGSFLQRPFSHMQGEGCKDCYIESMYQSIGEFLDLAFIQHGDKYLYETTSFVNNKKPINIVCSSHGEFKQAPYAHIRGQGCPSCMSSKGEDEVSRILDNFNIDYVRQWTDHGIPKAHNGKKMAYDFYIPTKNMVIEYDGEQHFKPINAWGGMKNLVAVKSRDSIKDKYCKDNGIGILRISYLDSIIDSIRGAM